MRILLVKTSSLGDVIHNLPVVSDLRLSFPEARIDWCVEEAFADIPRLHAAVDQVIPVAVRRWRGNLGRLSTWREIGDFRRRIGGTDYQLVLDTQGLLKSALIARQANGRHCGYAAEAAREPLAARFYDATFVIPRNVHAVQRNRWLAAAALDYPLELPLDYGISAPAPETAWLKEERLAILLTATSRDDKLWDEQHWCAVAMALREGGLTTRAAGRQCAGTTTCRTHRRRGRRGDCGAPAQPAADRHADGPRQSGDRCRYRPGTPGCGLASTGHCPLHRERTGADRRLWNGLRAQSRPPWRATVGVPSPERGRAGVALMCRLLYSLLFYLAMPLVWLRLVWRARRQPEYLQQLGERLGFYAPCPALPLIWLHAVSVGETRAAEPLIEALLRAYPEHGVLLTHMTPTGRASGSELLARHRERLTQAYLPYDLPDACGRFLDHFRPQIGLLMETELWPNLIAAARRRELPLALINARLSARSQRGYARLRRLIEPALASLSAVAAQTTADAERLQQIGARQVSVCGNLKFDVAPASDKLRQGGLVAAGARARASGSRQAHAKARKR
jgi:hypothetical protein